MSAVEPIDIGDARTLNAEFLVGGVLTDPTTLTFTMRQPDGSTVTYVYGTDAELIRDGAGTYRVEWTFQDPGIMVYDFKGTGAAQGTVGGAFWVEQSLSSYPPLCTRNDVILERRDLAASLYDMVDALIRRASWAVSEYARREFAISDVNVERRFPLGPGISNCASIVYIGDLAAVPTVVRLYDRYGNVIQNYNVATDLLYEPRTRKLRDPIRSIAWRSGTMTGYEMGVTGAWGFPIVPESAREATVATVIEWMKDDQALTLQSPDQFDPASGIPERGLPLRARDLLRPFREFLVG